MRSQQRIVATVKESVLKTEMAGLESQEEDAPKRILFFKSMSCLGLGDHLNTCTAHSGAKKAHDWMVDQLADLFRTTHKVKTQQVVKRRGQQQRKRGRKRDFFLFFILFLNRRSGAMCDAWKRGRPVRPRLRRHSTRDRRVIAEKGKKSMALGENV